MGTVRCRRALVFRTWLHRVAGLAPVAAVAACLISCAALEGLNPWAGPHSFVGVAFGDSPSEVERLYPQAQPATSPYGAEMLTVSDLESAGLRFHQVVFEFSVVHGMQVAAASFDPSAAEPLYLKLCKAFGEPPGAQSRPIRAHWQIADGTSVSIDSARGRMFFIGPYGGGLRSELPLIAKEWKF